MLHGSPEEKQQFSGEKSYSENANLICTTTEKQKSHQFSGENAIDNDVFMKQPCRELAIFTLFFIICL